MKTYPIPSPLLQVIVNYLQKRPWEEVNGFLIELGKVAQETDFPMQAQNGKDQPTAN